MREILRTVVPPEAHGRPLGEFLRRWCGVSRSLITRLKRQEGIRVNGQPRWTVHPVWAGEEVSLWLAEDPPPVTWGDPGPLAVVYEDDDVLVVDKPPGLVVHPARGHRTGTLAEAVVAYLAARGVAAPPRPVNRLDKDTSGLVLFAKSPWAHSRLAGHLHREYLAVAAGQVEPDAGTVSAPIRPVPGEILRREVHPEGQPAVTHFRVLARYPTATLLALTLETGRTHQIRVHMAHLGHPLVGDLLYGGPPDPIGRQALHAARLTFPQPRTGDPVAVAAPIPPDLAGLLARLGGSVPPEW